MYHAENETRINSFSYKTSSSSQSEPIVELILTSQSRLICSGDK